LFHVLIFGGSQGARAINNAMAEALSHLAGFEEKLSITHQTGEADLDKIKAAYADSKFAKSDIRPFISDMFTEFGKADLVICRAGATTCAELSAAGKASIMVPLPTAADDHQRKNAEALERAGAAKMILQSGLTGESLAAEISKLIEAPEAITAMETAAKDLGREDAEERTVDIIEELKASV
ncbi:MAG TPA: glycosyltransferase, partial [Nitrospira sp.]|nr:glycosyltransferase [Nitrospira sp.]